jgi:small subunit ribosomal protein S14
MKYQRYFKDSKKRKNYKIVEIFQRVIKIITLCNNESLVKILLYKKIFKISQFKTKIKNYCVISGRQRSVYRKLKISRIVLRNLGSLGLFFGLKKASW